MSWGQRIGASMRLRHGIGYRRIKLDYGPLTVSILKRVLHCHAVADCRIALGMNRDSCIRHVVREGHVRGIDVKLIHVEPGAFNFQPLENRRLYFVFALHTVATAAKESNRD